MGIGTGGTESSAAYVLEDWGRGVMRSVPFKVTSRATPYGQQGKDERLRLAHEQDAMFKCHPRCATAMAAAADPALQHWQCSASALLHMQPTAEQGRLLQWFSDSACHIVHSSQRPSQNKARAAVWLAWHTDPTSTDPDAQAASLKVCSGKSMKAGGLTCLFLTLLMKTTTSTSSSSSSSGCQEEEVATWTRLQRGEPTGQRQLR